MSTKKKGKGRRTTSPCKLDNLRCGAASVGRRAAEDIPPAIVIDRPLRWLEKLSGPVHAAVVETAHGHGYCAAELEEWMADALSTAYRSPSGLILRIGRKRKAGAEHAAAVEMELPLFNGTLDEAPGPEGSAP